MMRTWVAVALLVAGCPDPGGTTDTVPPSTTTVPTGGDAPTAAFEVVRDEALSARFDASASRDDGPLVAHWDFGDDSVGDGLLVDHRYAEAGCYTVRLTVEDEGGQTATAERQLRVVDQVDDTATIVLDGVPDDGTFLPRDLSRNEAVITLSGPTPEGSFERIVAQVFRDTTVEYEVEQELCGDAFSIEVPIAATRATHELQVGLVGLGKRVDVGGAGDLVAGDVFLVTGQSNAVAREYDGSADAELSPFVRSYGARTDNPVTHAASHGWVPASSGDLLGPVGQWPLRMASQLSARFDVPIAVLNGAHGGRPIGFFARNDEAPYDLTTNYGRLLDRTTRSGTVQHIRAILFYQGESDGADAQAHHDGFVALHEAWREDYAGMEQFYVTQVRLGCGGQIVTREVQRQFATELPDTTVMSTTGLDGHDGCHFAYAEGYRELGDRYAALLARDLYGATEEQDVEAVDVASVALVGDEIRIETTSDATELRVDAGVEAYFVLEGGSRAVSGVRAEGTTLFLTLTLGDDPTAVSFVGHPGAGPWVTNARGVGLLAFQIAL